jgi:hypothetical protein
MKILGKSIAAMSFLLASCAPVSGHTQLRFDVPRPSLEIRVGHRAPPSLRSERRTPRPGRDYVWLRGSWDLHGNDWAWIPGRWERPDHRSTRWVKARYRREGNAWRYEPAHWSNQRVVEGNDYREWRSKNDRNRGRGRDRD